jgi:uncharacterized protein YecE (DUF72 family)
MTRTAVAPGDVRIGISGWRYPPWRGVFYPEGLRQQDELAYASRKMRSVEINGSFYSLQRPSSYECWAREVPDDFVFAVKGGRFITHNKKLKDCESPLANFFASGVLALGRKLGPILWQLPPQLSFDADRLARFFDILPRTTKEAAEIAKGHDERLKHGALTEALVDMPLRHALEVRHDTFHDPAFLEVLRAHRIGLCIADTAGKFPAIDAVTADFVYVRLHGDKKLYVSGYGPAALDSWARRVGTWATGGKDVYVYFDNDVKVRAPFDAQNLAARLGQNEPVRFPRAKQAKAEKKRVEDFTPRETWDRWAYGRKRVGSEAG